MTSLVLGVLLWSGVHLFPSLGSEARSRVIGRVGEGPYKGLFALSLVAAIVLMVMGWRASTPIHVYAPPAWGALEILDLKEKKQRERERGGVGDGEDRQGFHVVSKWAGTTPPL